MAGHKLFSRRVRELVNGKSRVNTQALAETLQERYVHAPDTRAVGKIMLTLGWEKVSDYNWVRPGNEEDRIWK